MTGLNPYGLGDWNGLVDDFGVLHVNVVLLVMVTVRIRVRNSGHQREQCASHGEQAVGIHGEAESPRLFRLR